MLVREKRGLSWLAQSACLEPLGIDARPVFKVVKAGNDVLITLAHAQVQDDCEH